MSAVAPAPRSVTTWPTLVVLAVLWVATLTSQRWILGGLLLIWAAWDIATGESYFLLRIRRDVSPFTFWAVEVSWIGFGLLWIFLPS